MPQTTDFWQTAQSIGLLAGGLGLFLYGIGLLADALRQTADAAMRHTLARGTSSPLRGLALGTAITAILQSSSASTVLMVGFCNAGLLSLRQSVGLVLGSSIGGTITAQLLTVNWLSSLAPWTVCVGALLTLFTQRRATRFAGLAFLGFGLIFVGFNTMKAGVEPWTPLIQVWFQTLARPGILHLLASLGVGILATMVVQSAAVTTGLAIALAASGTITDLPSALALMIGCNIGTTVTTVLAAAGGTGAARQLAATHVIFRVLGGVISLLALPLYVSIFSGASPMARDLANFHTLHNAVNALIFLPLSSLLASAASRLVSSRADLSPAPLYIDFNNNAEPSERSSQAHREIMRLVTLTRTMTADALAGMATMKDRLFESVLEKEQLVDGLHSIIVQFLLITDDRPRPETSLSPARLLQVAHNIERIGDHAENLVELARFYQPPKKAMHAILHADLQETGRLLDDLFEAAAPALSGADATGLERLAMKCEAFDAFVAEKTDCAHTLARSGGCRFIDAALFEDFMANLRSSGSHILRAARAACARARTPLS